MALLLPGRKSARSPLPVLPCDGQSSPPPSPDASPRRRRRGLLLRDSRRRSADRLAGKENEPLDGSPGKTKLCSICLEPPGLTLRLACGHTGCSPCFRQYVAGKVRDGEVLERQLVCPFAADCKRPVDIEVLRQSPAAQFSRLLQLRAVRWRPTPESGLMVVYCGTPRCPPFLVSQPEARQALGCPTCSRQYCSGCQGDWHELGACHQAGREPWVQTMARKQGWTGCPVCGMIVEKRGGCNFITCTSARCNGLVFFCYLCGEEVDSKAHNSQEHFVDGPFGTRCLGLKKTSAVKALSSHFSGTRVCSIL